MNGQFNKYACPHCGNTDFALQEDNGEKRGSRNFALLCIKPCKPEDNSFGGFAPDIAECGMQWEPEQLEDEQTWTV